ncbi:MAG: VOC family protein [Candidatus Pacebacteria bacterium]|nr:VOC family protein [Candidatus Paceibacterota bacterium]
MITFEKISTVLLWSEDFRKLSDWYKEVFGFKVIEELDHPQDTGVLFEIEPGGTWLWIGQHSEVKGRNLDPHRHMFNISVGSVGEVYEYLLTKDVTFLAKPFKAPTFNKYFATFYDREGNIVQIIGGK